MQYRLSAAYEAAVTLIESTRAIRAGLPVLTRGPSDQGFASQADLTPPLPTLYSVVPPNQQPSVVLGDVVTITGVHLDGTNVAVRFDHPLWVAPVEVIPLAGATATTLTVKIPNVPSVWAAGFYTLDVLVQRTGETFRRTTNQLSLSLAATVTLAPTSAPAGAVTYTATVSPDVRPAQRASLILGDQEFLAVAITAQSATLTFNAMVAAGTFLVRLRVDGVDSRMVDPTQTPPVYVAQQVTVT